MAETYYTVKEVAERLRVHVETVRRWIKAGDLTAVRLGDRTGYRISEADLRAFTEGRKEAPIWAEEREV